MIIKIYIIYINEALYSYFGFSKIFNDYHSKKYNPKIMLFVETNIFQQILFTFSNICSTFHKPSATNWIIFKIFETSPFILNNVHYQAGNILVNFLEKNKNKMNRYYKDFLKNKNLMDEYEKIKKYFTKIIERLNEKNINNKNIKEVEIKTGEGYDTKSIQNKTIKQNNVSVKFSSNLNTSHFKSFYNLKNRISKNITICIHENILEKIKWEEFQSIIIKYLNKYFMSNENDKFGFVQFGINGLITKSFHSQPLNEFISKFYKIKNNNILIDDSLKIKSEIFIGIYDIFDSIINNYKKTEIKDNIILMFIDDKDIRFSSVSDCLNIVEALNENNTSVFFFCFNKIIGDNKINNIQSFLNGLIEGYFFQIKNYNQLKEIFTNLSIKEYQTNFFKYDYTLLDHNL